MAPWSVVVVVVCATLACLPMHVDNRRNTFKVSPGGMSTRLFEGLPNVVEVECAGDTLGATVELFSMTLYAIVDDIVLASVSLAKSECGTSSSFSACFIDTRDPFNTRLKTLVVDLQHEEQRLYGCNLSLNEAGRPAIMHWAIAATLHKVQQTTSTTAFPGYTTFTVADIPVASEVLEPTTDLHVPSSAVIVGLLLLVFFIILTIALIAIRFRGNTSSNQSWHYDEPHTPVRDDLYAKPIFPADKERKLGGLLRDTPSHSPTHLAPNTPPRNPAPALLVRYQTPLGSSAYYAEPWGRPDEEGDRLRPVARAGVAHLTSDVRVARTCHVINCDEKGGPLGTGSQDDNT